MNESDNIVEILDRHVESILEGVHTTFPGRVESYNATRREAVIKPLVRLRMASGPLVSIPPIPAIPVILPGSGAFSLDFPLVAGDSVLVVCSETAIGNWLQSQSGEEADPEDSARFSMTDAIAIPGLWPFRSVPNSPTKITATADSLKLVTNPGVEVELASDGKLSLKNNAGSVKALMDDIWTELSNLTSDVNTWALPFATPPVSTSPVLGAAIGALSPVLVTRLASITAKAQLVQGVLK